MKKKTLTILLIVAGVLLLIPLVYNFYNLIIAISNIKNNPTNLHTWLKINIMKMVFLQVSPLLLSFLIVIISIIKINKFGIDSDSSLYKIKQKQKLLHKKEKLQEKLKELNKYIETN